MTRNDLLNAMTVGAIALFALLPHAEAQQASTAAESVDAGRVFGAWRITCEQGPCLAFLSLRDDATGDIVLSASLIHDRPSGKDTLLIRVGLGVALPPGLRIFAEDETRFNAPFQVCQSDGCIAGLLLTPEVQDALRGVFELRVAAVPYGQQQAVGYALPIEGWRDALDHLAG